MTLLSITIYQPVAVVATYYSAEGCWKSVVKVHNRYQNSWVPPPGFRHSADDTVFITDEACWVGPAEHVLGLRWSHG